MNVTVFEEIATVIQDLQYIAPRIFHITGLVVVFVFQHVYHTVTGMFSGPGSRGEALVPSPVCCRYEWDAVAAYKDGCADTVAWGMAPWLGLLAVNVLAVIGHTLERAYCSPKTTE